MTILKRVVKFLKERSYKKYKAKSCPSCGKFNWKYAFAPYVIKKKKGLLEARVCGSCGFKDPAAHFLNSSMKLDSNTTFENKN